MRTLNGKIAVSPPKETAVKISARGEGVVKVGQIDNKVSLVKLEVIFAGGNLQEGFYEFQPGEAVYVRASHFTQPWAKEIHKNGDKEFVLMPISFVECHEQEGIGGAAALGDVTIEKGGEYISTKPSLNDLF